jgi:hypothetical protein
VPEHLSGGRGVEPQAVTLYRGAMMRSVKCLAALPFIGILVGVPLLNQVYPLILGLPLVLAWIVLWILATAAIMGLIYRTDPANRSDPASQPAPGPPPGPRP